MTAPLDLTFIGAIENSKNRFVEKEYLLLVRSIRKNGGAYASSPIVFLQPTENNISPRTMIELKRLNADFVRPPSPLLRETGRGFLNMPIACSYLASMIKTKYMLWLDCDTYVFKEPLFRELEESSVMIHSNMSEYKRFFNEGHQRDYVEDVEAQSYLHDLLAPVPGLRHVNTWHIFAKTASSFWSDWERETFLWVDKVKQNASKVLKSGFVNFSGQGTEHPPLDYALSSVEEIAAGILEKKYNYVEPAGTGHQWVDGDTRICHYDDWNILIQIFRDPEILNDMKEIERVCRP